MTIINESAFVVNPTYKIKNDKAYVYLFGKLSSGKSFLSVSEFKPYFFIKSSDEKKALEASKVYSEITSLPEFKKTDFVDFNKNKISKVSIVIPKEIPALRKLFEANNIRCYEADVRFEYRFMMDNDIKGSFKIKSEPVDKFDLDENETYNVDYLFFNPNFEKDDTEINLKILSFDIETSMRSDLYSIALYLKDFKTSKVNTTNLIVSDNKVKNAISFPTEKELLIEFSKLIVDMDPDIITGWNVIDFDFRVLQSKYRRYKIPMEFGRTNEPPRMFFVSDFMQTSKVNIPGRVVIDGMDMLKGAFIKLPDYKLNTAAREILSDEKLITGEEDENKGIVIENMSKNDPDKLVEYNQKDSELVVRILEKKDLIKLAIKRSQLTGMPLDRINASVASLDSLYLRTARKKGVVCSSVSNTDKMERGKGGYVMEPNAGIYDNVLVLDFKSLYPSIIITFNIDPMSFSETVPKNKSEYIEAPNGAFFKNEEGILGEIIQGLWKQRDLVKKKNDLVASYAIKIIMNSFYGALGNSGCRFFNLNISNAITYFGQFIIQNTAKEVEKKGYEVIYSDTDSVFVNTGLKNIDDANKLGFKLEKDINNYYKKWVKDNYNRTSAMELEYEKIYRKIIFPAQRGSTDGKGAKKRYAGLLVKGDSEKLDFTGLEFVRRDWTELSKKFQLELLDRVFNEKPVIEFVKNFIKDVYAKKYDEDMIYIKAIRKDLTKYVKTTPPHVKAARKLDKIKSNIIKYYMTTDGPEPIQKLEHEIDYEHYIEKQIKPIADSVLVFFNTNFDDLIKGSTQKDLFSF